MALQTPVPTAVPAAIKPITSNAMPPVIIVANGTREYVINAAPKPAPAPVTYAAVFLLTVPMPV